MKLFPLDFMSALFYYLTKKKLKCVSKYNFIWTILIFFYLFGLRKNWKEIIRFLNSKLLITITLFILKYMQPF